MGKVLSTRRKENNKVVCEVELDYEEALSLEGYMDNIFMVSTNNIRRQTSIGTRGSGEGTKYFLIPRDLRSELSGNAPVRCERFEQDARMVFVYVVDKLQL